MLYFFAMAVLDESYQNLLINNYSGSSQLLKSTTAWLHQALENGKSESEILVDLEKLCKAHPSMALIQNFSAFFHKISPNSQRIHSWMEMYHKHEAAACEKFAEHLSNFTNVLVHSFSGLVYQSLKQVPKTLNIFCTESRPAYEGRALAEKLAETRHKVYLISDMAAFSVLSRVEIVAFGCDSITSRGIVNKIGTAPLAEIAQRQGKMNYFIGTGEKVLQDWDDDFLMRQGSRNEIYSGERKLQIENYYFDLTPPSNIGGLFLENGLSGNL